MLSNGLRLPQPSPVGAEIPNGWVTQSMLRFEHGVHWNRKISFRTGRTGISPRLHHQLTSRRWLQKVDVVHERTSLSREKQATYNTLVHEAVI